MHTLKYCPECNYAISEQEIVQSRIDYTCPNCNSSRIHAFYSIGSRKHKQRLKGFGFSNAPSHTWIKPPAMPAN